VLDALLNNTASTSLATNKPAPTTKLHLQDTLSVLKRIGNKHKVSSSLVAMRWVLQQRGVYAIVVGARNAMHLGDARRLYTFELDDIDMLDVDAAYEGAQQPTADVYAWERGGNW